MADASDGTALIIPVQLPPALERLRRRSVPDAITGLPAHATLLYPFAAEGGLDEVVRAKLGTVVASHPEFSFRLAGLGQWPGALFASVEPEDPFRALYADLLAVFPDFPSHGGRFEFVPHVTVAVGPAAADPETATHPAWRSLPALRRASRADLIVRGPTGWDLRWSFPLAGIGEGSDPPR